MQGAFLTYLSRKAAPPEWYRDWVFSLIFCHKTLLISGLYSVSPSEKPYYFSFSCKHRIFFVVYRILASFDCKRPWFGTKMVPRLFNARNLWCRKRHVCIKISLRMHEKPPKTLLSKLLFLKSLAIPQKTYNVSIFPTEGGKLLKSYFHFGRQPGDLRLVHLSRLPSAKLNGS